MLWLLLKKFYTGFFALLLCALIVLYFVFETKPRTSQDVPTENNGEKAMIACLRSVINEDPELKTKAIILGAGKSGAEAFKTPPLSKEKHVLLTWQWLDPMNHLAPGTIVVAPEHALNKDFDLIRNKVTLIPIQGVLHTRTKESTAKEETTGIFKNTHIIVMLGGDTEQPDGSWKPYAIKDAETLLQSLPKDKNILFLNGPRTGKHKIDHDGRLVIAPDAHRTEIDSVTQYVMDQCVQRPWHVNDFKFGEPSLWGSALKTCAENMDIILILPGESTSMISEALTLGIHPVIYTHPAMTNTSLNYVKQLNTRQQITLYPSHRRRKNQPPIEPQQYMIIETLKTVIKEG